MLTNTDQYLAHAIGDYIIQSDWMAEGKTRSVVIAIIHAVVYSLPFLFFSPSFAAWAAIAGTHAVIDRYRLARYAVWAKNWMGPNRPWAECSATGYPPSKPAFLSVWLLIIADNILHVTINAVALRFL